jgi:RNA methyltransferase, TrmH family
MHPRNAHPHKRREESELVCGLHAGLAVFQRRRDDILRVGFSRDVRSEIGDLVRFVTSRRLPCEELPDKALDRMMESTHHEGLVLVTRPRHWTAAKQLADVLLQTGGAAIALDRVRNPHNVGAVLRSSAYFGFQAALLGTPAPHPGLPPAAVRVSEGGAEHLLLSRTTDLADTLARLRARGVRVIGADARADASADRFVFLRPLVLVLGNEREGLGDRIRAQCDALVAIRGAGTLDSLNVAVAAGVLMAAVMRGGDASSVGAHPPRAPGPARR